MTDPSVSQTVANSAALSGASKEERRASKSSLQRVVNQAKPACPSLTRQGGDEISHQVKTGFFIPPGTVVMLQEMGIGCKDDDHIKYVQKHNLLTTVPIG